MTQDPTPPRVLHLIASPRRGSSSTAIGQAHLDELRRQHPGAHIETLDLWSLDLPSIDGDLLDAKYAILARRPHEPAQADAWARVRALVAQFLGFDHYVFSVPMWNLGIPYRLKHYIDVITQPGLTFSWTPERGYEGLVHGRTAVVVYASAFDYTPGSPLRDWDQQKAFMATWLRYIGIESIEAIDAGPTRPSEAGAPAAREAAEARARQLAQIPFSGVDRMR